MDPAALIKKIVEELEFSDRHQAALALDDLVEWMGKSGRLPKFEHADLAFILSSFGDYLRQ